MIFQLQHLLTESAARRPDAIAVRLEETALTYAVLETKSNQLAHALAAAGVAPGDRVGIHIGKSLESIISVFGVLKAGACYVPIDGSAPAARVADIVRQCGIECLITAASAVRGLKGAGQLPLQRLFLVDAPVEAR